MLFSFDSIELKSCSSLLNVKRLVAKRNSVEVLHLCFARLSLADLNEVMNSCVHFENFSVHF